MGPTISRAMTGGLLLTLESVAKRNRFEFNANGIVNWNHRSRFKHKGRKHRAEFVNRGRIVAIQQHVTAPVTHTNHEHLDLEIPGRLPLREHLQNSFLRVLVFNGRTLRTFCPSQHVLHLHSPVEKCSQQLLEPSVVLFLSSCRRIRLVLTRLWGRGSARRSARQR